jgi:tetratricopeptide (TPR) repeat protein
MLADCNESAIELGRDALRLAEQLGLDDLRGHALNNIGSARGNTGDEGGFADIEESIAIASRLNSAADLIRGHNNLAAVQFIHGHMEEALAEWRETRRLAEQFGHVTFVRFVDSGPGVATRYMLGEWDEALALANAVVEEVESGASRYHAAVSQAVRGLIRLARADPAGAEADAERTIELARPVRDPQLLQPQLARAAFIFVSCGNAKRAEETLDESLADLRELREFGFACVELRALAWVALNLGREDELRELIDRQFESPWVQAGRAVTSGEFQHAADILGGIGARADEAFYRLRAAEQLVGEGRRAEADGQLRRALAFYRGAGATRYVREGEALLAASA